MINGLKRHYLQVITLKDNTIWYQINPNYFEQILIQQEWIDKNHDFTFFELVLEDLDRIKKLGCTGIWLMPIYERGQVARKGFGSPYAVKEYHIDSKWGTDEQLKNLIQEAKAKGFKVLGEYVPNHLAPDAPFLNIQEGLFYLDPAGKPFHDQDWRDTVKLNHSHPSVQGFTSANLIWLTKNYGFDGFRLDMAHYPLYGAQQETSFGSGDSLFWKKILRNSDLADLGNIWIAEVYDDRDKGNFGYADQIKLIEEGMMVYDKKTHDILARRLRYQRSSKPIQEQLFDELYIQSQVLHSIGIDIKQNVPFLRMPSNHDDSPGVRIYGGVSEYLAAFALLSLLPGHSILYAGEEFGLKIKPSVVGVNFCNEKGEMLETNHIKFIDKEKQKTVNDFVSKLLAIRSHESVLNKGYLLFCKLKQNDGSISPDLVSFIRYSPEEKEIILIAVNLSNGGEKSWGKVSEFFPTFDFPKYEFNWIELLKWVNPDFVEKGYKWKNLLNNEMSDKKKKEDEFWLGLNPLEVQILKIVVA